MLSNSCQFCSAGLINDDGDDAPGWGNTGFTGMVVGWPPVMRSDCPNSLASVDARQPLYDAGYTVTGTPSRSLSMRTFFSATTSPVCLSLARYTTPYVPSPMRPGGWNGRIGCQDEGSGPSIGIVAMIDEG